MLTFHSSPLFVFYIPLIGEDEGGTESPVYINVVDTELSAFLYMNSLNIYHSVREGFLFNVKLMSL